MKKNTRVFIPKLGELLYSRCLEDNNFKHAQTKTSAMTGVVNKFLKEGLRKMDSTLHSRLKSHNLSEDTLYRALNAKGKTNPGCELSLALALCIYINKEKITLKEFCKKNDIPVGTIIEFSRNKTYEKLTIFEEADLLQSGNEMVAAQLKNDLTNTVPATKNKLEAIVTSLETVQNSGITTLQNLCDVAIRETGIIEFISWQGKENSILLENVYVHREIEALILNDILFSIDQKVSLISGEAGYGKTSLLWYLYNASKKHFENAYFLKASQLRLIDFDSFLSVLKAKRAIFFIDTVDVQLHTEIDKEKLGVILNKLLQADCRLILTTRPQEFRIAESLFDNGNVLKYKLGNYSEDKELREAIYHYTQEYLRNEPLQAQEKVIQHVLNLTSNNKSLLELCKTPLTLKMLFSIYAPLRIPEEINVFRLYEAYWDAKVKRDKRRVSDTIPLDFNPVDDLSSVTAKIALIMLYQGTPELYFPDCRSLLQEKGVQLQDILTLCNRGILKGNPLTTAVSFFHQTFFEFAAGYSIIHLGGGEALESFKNKLFETSTGDEVDVAMEYFFLPIFEQVLLIGESSSLKKLIDISFTELLTKNSSRYSSSALHVYVLLETPSTSVVENVQLYLKGYSKSNSKFINRFLTTSINISQRRLSSLTTELQIIWERDIWNEQYHVIELLDYFSLTAPELILAFIKENKIVETILKRHKASNQEKHSAIQKIFASLLFKVYPFDIGYSGQQLQTIISNLVLSDLLYVMEITIINDSADWRSLQDIILKCIISESGSGEDEKLILEVSRANRIAKYWLKVWSPRQSIEDILSDACQETNAVLAQTKIAALVEISPGFSKEDAELVYHFYATRLTKYQKIRWAKWLFALLIDKKQSEIPYLLRLFTDDLNKDFEYELSQPSNSISIAALPVSLKPYFECFFESTKPNSAVFQNVDSKIFLTPSVWERMFRMVDIYISGHLATHIESLTLTRNLLETKILPVGIKVASRVNTNLIAKNIYNVDLTELTIKMLIASDDPIALNGLLERTFIQKSNAILARELKERLIAHKEDFWGLIKKSFKRGTHLEGYGRLWATCIEHGVLDKPFYKEVLALLGGLNGFKYKTPALLRLLPLCTIPRYKDLEEVLQFIHSNFNGPRFYSAAQLAYLQVLSTAIDPIKISADKILSIATEVNEKGINDDKIKALKRIIISQARINPELAFTILCKFYSAPLWKLEKPRKRNELSHDMYGACVAVFKLGNKRYNKGVLNLLKQVDIHLGRSIIDAAFHSPQALQISLKEIDSLINGDSISEDVRILLRNKRRFVSSPVNYQWSELLEFI